MLRWAEVPRHAEGRDAVQRVGKWMKQLGVESLAKRRAGQLSGGEAQRSVSGAGICAGTGIVVAR